MVESGAVAIYLHALEPQTAGGVNRTRVGIALKSQDDLDLLVDGHGQRRTPVRDHCLRLYGVDTVFQPLAAIAKVATDIQGGVDRGRVRAVEKATEVFQRVDRCA